MTWKKLNDWCLENGEWTLTKPGRPDLCPLPYGLHHGRISHGFYATRALAEIAYTELSAPVKPSAMHSKSTNRGASDERD